jgi:PAS domain S-box-containing protein
MTDQTVESLSAQIVASAADAVIFADRDGVIRLWNAGAEAMFGYTAQEAVGQRLDLIVPERQRSRHWEGWARVMDTGVTKYGRGDLLAVPAQRRDGARISLEFTIALLKDGQGRVTGAAAILRDVTERWQRDRDLRVRLAELEAKVKETAQ